MNRTTRLRIALFCTILATLLLVAAAVTMLQSPRPVWSRNLIMPALVLILLGRLIRRTSGEEGGRTP